MDEPNGYDIEHIQAYLSSDAMVEVGNDGRKALALRGLDHGIWGSTQAPMERANDLITIQPLDRGDSFSRWFTYKAVRKLFDIPCLCKPKPSKITGLPSYKETTLLRFTLYVTSILASLLLTLSITVLWLIKSSGWRLVTIAVFNLLLSVCLTACTTATRAEIFSVTATYVFKPVSLLDGEWLLILHSFAAVQVVFVGTTIGNGVGN